VILLRWNNLLRGCSAVGLFDFFYSSGLATPRYRHHCLAALRGDKTTHAPRMAPSLTAASLTAASLTAASLTGRTDTNVQALFDATFRQ
jgi:hypothetical protein